MTKRIGPEQEAHLKALGAARRKLLKIRERENAAMREVHTLIRDGFYIHNISGLKLAEYSGLSLPRVYQVQKEEPAYVIENHGGTARSESATETKDPQEATASA